jgi:hypothetical protein
VIGLHPPFAHEPFATILSIWPHAAERWRRHRAAAPAPRVPPRLQRCTLVALQDEYRAWLERLPESLEGSATAEKLQAITEIDLDELLAIDPPRGYGRD